VQRAEVTPEVWAALLALASGRPAGPAAGWPEAARAAWELYAPIAADGQGAPYFFAQVGQSLDYVRRVVPAFAARLSARPTLLVVLGDHQPAAFVSEDETSRDVPLHLIGPPDLLAKLDGWRFTPGLVPAADAPVWRMDAFRDRFLEAFGGAAPLHADAR
jgi:hypothetical protein